jgi:hypothetical protein
MSDDELAADPVRLRLQSILDNATRASERLAGLSHATDELYVQLDLTSLFEVTQTTLSALKNLLTIASLARAAIEHHDESIASSREALQ